MPDHHWSHTKQLCTPECCYYIEVWKVLTLCIEENCFSDLRLVLTTIVPEESQVVSYFSKHLKCVKKRIFKLLFIVSTTLSGTWPVKWHTFVIKHLFYSFMWAVSTMIEAEIETPALEQDPLSQLCLPEMTWGILMPSIPCIPFIPL